MDAESAVNAGQAAGVSKRAATPPPSEPPTAAAMGTGDPTGTGGAIETGRPSGNGGVARTPRPGKSAAREAWAAGTANGGIVADITANGDTEAETGDGLAGPPPGAADGSPTRPADGSLPGSADGSPPRPADGSLPGPADGSPPGPADGSPPRPAGDQDDGAAAGLAAGTVPTIYDVARSAGVSIASVSRVLNGRRNPRPETRDRVLQAVSELGFIPDGAARALSVRLKEVAGVIIRLPWASRDPEDLFADEEDSLQFPDMINRGIAEAAQRRGFDILVRSVDLDEHDPGGRILALARKSDGIILHDRVLEPDQLVWLARQVPVVTMAGVGTPTTANVRSDNTAGMRDLARHLLHDHGYRSISYIGGHVDSPDSIARFGSLAAEVADAGAEFLDGPEWQGNYTAGGGARVINNLLARHTALPRAIVCANDQTAIGVLHALERHGVSVPDDVAVTGFDDIPVARHLHTQLTTVRQRIRELGATAFEVLYSMINHQIPADRDIVLPTTLIRRQSCGCGRERQA